MKVQNAIAKGLAKTALLISKKDANTACLLWGYQPDLPAEVKELCKFK